MGPRKRMLILAMLILVAVIGVVSLALAWGTKRLIPSDAVQVIQGNWEKLDTNLVGWVFVLTNTTGKALLVCFTEVETKSETGWVSYGPKPPVGRTQPQRLISRGSLVQAVGLPV